MLASVSTLRRGGCGSVSDLVQMSGGDWPEEFKILAHNSKLEGTALMYLQKMMPGWTAVSNSLEYVMISMLVLYMTPIPSARALS
ncbi:hypothetical protein GN244_ATG17932 [Phytophthora infestans]|uniref:Uncharacterized protein n=1 Tax=Phytophthora infestans TaxID=4787 RepID=A0A833WKK2_PHYIN|nr:hypothetical protein GN244_ATG17932 [Phytophthora infestans]